MHFYNTKSSCAHKLKALHPEYQAKNIVRGRKRNVVIRASNGSRQSWWVGQGEQVSLQSATKKTIELAVLISKGSEFHKLDAFLY